MKKTRCRYIPAQINYNIYFKIQFNYYFRHIIVLGEHNLDTDIDCDQQGTCADEPQRIKPQRVVGHPKYNKETKQYDIAIIKFEKKAILTSNFKDTNLTKN